MRGNNSPEPPPALRRLRRPSLSFRWGDGDEAERVEMEPGGG